MHRRTFLAATGAVAVAGCLGDDGTDGPGRADHPATGTFEGAPWLGTDPGAATDLIVAFEDPSCGICGRFHQGTLPDLQADLLGDDAAFVYRPYPIRYDWGGPASQAVVATADRDRAAGNALVGHYYGESAFDVDNVLDRTASFLDSQTDLDGAAVAEDVEADAYGDVVDAHLGDGEAADATTTPTFFLFSGEAFVTEITGAQGADVFLNALDR